MWLLNFLVLRVFFGCKLPVAQRGLLSFLILQVFFSRRILLENEPDYYSGYFFRRVRSTFLFICPTTSNLNNFKPQQLQPQKRVQNEKKKQNRRPELRKHTKDLPIAPLFFDTTRLFETFWIAPKGPPSFVSIFCNTMDVKKWSPLLQFSAL